MKDIINGIKNKTQQQLKNPGAVFGLLYPYVLVVGLILGIYYVKNLDNISRENVPPVIQDSTVVTDLTVKNAVVVPPVNVLEFKNPTPELLAEGEKLFKANCASCHGENGAGGGPASMGLNPAPRNFTSKDNWKNGTKISQIYTTLQEGLPPSAMASYDYLLPKEKFALAQYIRTNFIPDPAKDTDADLQNLDATYNLSAGQQIPAQIPVAKASLLIISENENKIEKLKSALENLKTYSNDDGAKIFDKVTLNKKLALSFLIRNAGWKENPKSFNNLVVNNVNQNGFNGAVFNLTNDEWSKLQSFISKLI
ncbi:MAG TPA: cytochrome c [Ignavibacteriaceae bacterium]|nr:cytochrome c [Ignavibacteriaceae bacterium]